MNWVPKKWLHSFTSLPFGGCLCALFGLWCVSRQMELTPAVLSSHKVLWWRGTVAPEAGDISLQWSLSSHCLYLDEKAVGIRWSCLTLRWQLCPSARGGQAGSCCTWKYEIVLLTFGYWLSKKKSRGCIFPEGSGYWLSCVHNMDAIKNAVVKNPSSTNLSSGKKNPKKTSEDLFSCT